MRIFREKNGHLNVCLWHGPYNGGWVWFDKKHWKRFSCGWRRPKLWWCFGGFCGRITLQTWPWARNPMKR